MAHKNEESRVAEAELLKYQKRLNKRIKALRLEYGYTQADFLRFGIATRTYNRLENEPESITKMPLLFKLAQIYEISLSELLDV